MIRNINIGMRSALAFGVICLFLLGVSTFSIYKIGEINATTDVLTLERMRLVTLASELRKQTLLSRVRVAQITDETDSIRINSIIGEIDGYWARYTTLSKDVGELIHKADEKSVFQDVFSAYSDLHRALPSYYSMVTAAGQKYRSIEYRRQTLAPAFEHLTQSLDELVLLEEALANQVNDQATSSYKNAVFIIILVSATALLLTIALAVLYSRSVVKPIKSMMRILNKIADGKLNNVINDDANDELGEMFASLKFMQTNLSATISQIGNASDHLACTSEELSVVTQEATKVVNQQSDQLEMAAAAVTEMTTAIEEVARSANLTSDNAEIADEKTKIGQQKVNDTIETIQSLTNEIQISSENVATLAQRIRNIGSILDVIRDIADQTNLLALNAAIEAARAGETGRSFAVVADEVRALAHRTQTSTLEIEDLIQSVQDQTNAAVERMTISTERSTVTLETANEVNEVFVEITKLVSQINEQNLTIATASEQQASVAREVDRNLTEVKTLSETNVTGSEQTSSTSLELANLAESLNRQVLKFTLS